MNPQKERNIINLAFKKFLIKNNLYDIFLNGLGFNEYDTEFVHSFSTSSTEFCNYIMWAFSWSKYNREIGRKYIDWSFFNTMWERIVSNIQNKYFRHNLLPSKNVINNIVNCYPPYL